jgi:hypothetical protein
MDAGSYKRITATGNVKPIGGRLVGVLVSTTTSGTIQLYDSATTTTTAPITGTLTLAAGSFTPIPATFIDGLYAVIGGTLDATIIYA